MDSINLSFWSSYFDHSCAFANTPKFNQVKGNNVEIVTVHKSYKQRFFIISFFLFILIRRHVTSNRPFLKWFLPLRQNEFSCGTINLKMSAPYIQAHFHAEQTCLYKKGFATKTRFETEAQGNTEMAFCIVTLLRHKTRAQSIIPM